MVFSAAVAATESARVTGVALNEMASSASSSNSAREMSRPALAISGMENEKVLVTFGPLEPKSEPPLPLGSVVSRLSLLQAAKRIPKQTNKINLLKFFMIRKFCDNRLLLIM